MLSVDFLRPALLALALACMAPAGSANTPRTPVPASHEPAPVAAKSSAASTAAATSGRRNAPEFARIASHGELVVAMLKTDTPPFFFERDQKLQGIDVDMARELARGLGVPVRFDRRATSFNEVVDIVSRGEADIGISKISRTLARSQAVLFSEPYLTLRQALILNRLEFAKMARDRTPEQAVRDFTGTLGVIANSSFADFAPVNFRKAKIRPYASWDELVAAVRRGDVVGGYRDEFEVKRLLSEHPTAALQLRTITLKDLDDTIGIAVGADAPTLLAYVNMFLATRQTKLEIGAVLKALPPVEQNVSAK
jgi:ABC-type amino acid transport substrate-binding protein